MCLLTKWYCVLVAVRSGLMNNFSTPCGGMLLVSRKKIQLALPSLPVNATTHAIQLTYTMR